MQKTLFLSSLFLFNLCTAQDETATAPEQTLTITSNAATSSIVFDFVLELDSLNESWTAIINKAKTIIPNETESSKIEFLDCLKETLQLTKTIQDKILNNEDNSNVHGSLKSSVTELENFDINKQPELSEPNFVIIRYVITKYDKTDSQLWTLLQNIIKAHCATTEQEKSLNNLTDSTDAVNEIINLINTDENVESVCQDLDIIYNQK